MKRMLVALSSFFFALCGCQGARTPSQGSEPVADATTLKRGGVYATLGEDNKYLIMKILALGDGAVHVRFYNEKFDTVPESIDTTQLTYLIGHAPMAEKGFLADKPTLVTVEAVKDEELEGYNMYLQAMSERER